MSDEHDLLTRHEVIARLGGTIDIYYWVRRQLMPTVAGPVVYRRYPRAYIERLLHFSNGATPKPYQAQLVMLEWRHQHGTLEERLQVRDSLAKMRQDGLVYSPGDVAELTGYSRYTVSIWRDRGFLPSIRIDRRSFCLKCDALRVSKVIGWLTTCEAAEQLGVVNSVVIRLVRDQELAAVQTPNGLRFDPEEVKRYQLVRDTVAQQKAVGWPAGKVRSFFDIGQTTLSTWCDLGLLEFTIIHGQRSFAPASVLRLQEQRQTLNGGFEWLESIGAEATCTTKAAARKLGLGHEALRSWSSEGLVPYYDLTPPGLGRVQIRCYVASYIDGLAAFAGALPVPRDAARQYKKIVQEQTITRRRNQGS